MRCLAWCPRDTKYLFSGEKVNCRNFLVQTKNLNQIFDAGGADKWCFIWDLRQPTSPPVQRASRSEGISIDDNYYFLLIDGIVTRAVWPLAWPGIFIVEDFVK